MASLRRSERGLRVGPSSHLLDRLAPQSLSSYCIKKGSNKINRPFLKKI
uniref:Uncharacterized protein n=1 Tax=Anguilla anguilla TaxID=7936 RepID=A0A0E9R833_ANGAN